MIDTEKKSVSVAESVREITEKMTDQLNKAAVKAAIAAMFSVEQKNAAGDVVAVGSQDLTAEKILCVVADLICDLWEKREPTNRDHRELPTGVYVELETTGRDSILACKSCETPALYNRYFSTAFCVRCDEWLMRDVPRPPRPSDASAMPYSKSQIADPGRGEDDR